MKVAFDLSVAAFAAREALLNLPPPADDRPAQAPASAGQLLDSAKTRLGTLSEMGEMESPRMQMAMDRLSKLMSTISNVMHKVSETQGEITQNMK